MPVLKDPKHEAYAQGLAKGLSADAAYQKAGYKPNRGNATRLKANESIQARVKELTEKTAEKALDNSAFEARTMFEAVLQDIQDAKAAGDHKTAADLRKFFISCFGYEDSPTITHEHIKGKPLKVSEKIEDEDRPATVSNLTSFADAIKKMKRRAS